MHFFCNPLVFAYNRRMAKRQRTYLFFTLLFLFLFGTPVLIFYSQGYRIDFKTKSISQTGGLYIKTVPTSVTVSIDNIVKKQTSFLFGTILFENLLPETYSVALFKDGYHSWRKNLSVTQKEVTEAKNIILFPNDIAFTAVKENISGMWKSPNREYAVLQDTKRGLILLHFQTNKEQILSTQTITQDIQWDALSTRIFVNSETPRIFHIKNGICENGCALNQNVQQAHFPTPLSTSILFINDAKTLAIADYTKRTAPTNIARNVMSFLLSEDDLFWLDENGIAHHQSLSFDNPAETLHNIQLPDPAELFLFDNRLFALSHTFFELKNDEFEEILFPATSAVLSPDKRKLALANESELWLYFLKDQADQKAKKAGDKIFLTRLSQPIDNLAWISDHYLLFSSGNTLKIAETDERDTVNIIDIGTFPGPTLFWQGKNKIIYVLSDGVLYNSDKVIR